MTLRTYREAEAWLRAHVDELETAPARIHESAVGDKDALGALRFTGAFWAVLTGSPFATRWVQEQRACPEPKHGHPHPICPRCEDQFTYRVDIEEYQHPLAAAIASIRGERSTAPTWLSPYALVVLLLRSGLDLQAASLQAGHPIVSEDHRRTVEAQFLAAIRRVHSRWVSRVYRRVDKPSWIDRSEAQRNAEAA